MTDRKNKYLNPYRLHFLSSRGFVIEAIKGMNGKKFSKKELHREMFGKLSISSVNLVLSELKYANIIMGYRDGRSYFYKVANEKILELYREDTEILPQRSPYKAPESVSLCLACEGTTIDIAASESRGRPLFCEECNGDGAISTINSNKKGNEDA